MRIFKRVSLNWPERLRQEVIYLKGGLDLYGNYTCHEKW